MESHLSASAFRGRGRELPLVGKRLSRRRSGKTPFHAGTVGRNPSASPTPLWRSGVSPGLFSHRGRGAVREQCHLLSAGQESLARRISLTHNPSLVRTHSGMPRKPAVLCSKHRRTSGLRGTPAWSAQLERYTSLEMGHSPPLFADVAANSPSSVGMVNVSSRPALTLLRRGLRACLAGTGGSPCWPPPGWAELADPPVVLHGGSSPYNPSLKRTHSGMPRKPAVRPFHYPHTSGLRSMPARSAQLER